MARLGRLGSPRGRDFLSPALDSVGVKTTVPPGKLKDKILPSPETKCVAILPGYAVIFLEQP